MTIIEKNETNTGNVDFISVATGYPHSLLRCELLYRNKISKKLILISGHRIAYIRFPFWQADVPATLDGYEVIAWRYIDTNQIVIV